MHLQCELPAAIGFVETCQFHVGTGFDDGDLVGKMAEAHAPFARKDLVSLPQLEQVAVALDTKLVRVPAEYRGIATADLGGDAERPRHNARDGD